MTVQLLTEIDRIRGFHRKPASWAEVGLPVPLSLLENLKQFTAKELGIEHSISATFKTTPEDNVFLVGWQGGLYLVNTEGNDYARYVRYVGSAN